MITYQIETVFQHVIEIGHVSVIIEESCLNP